MHSNILNARISMVTGCGVRQGSEGACPPRPELGGHCHHCRGAARGRQDGPPFLGQHAGEAWPTDTA